MKKFAFSFLKETSSFVIYPSSISFFFLCNIIHFIYESALLLVVSLISCFKFLILYLYCYLYLSLYFLVHILFVSECLLLYYCGFSRWVLNLHLDIMWEVPLGGRSLISSRRLFTLLYICCPFTFMFIPSPLSHLHLGEDLLQTKL